jgi:hypothetical protein
METNIYNYDRYGLNSFGLFRFKSNNRQRYLVYGHNYLNFIARAVVVSLKPWGQGISNVQIISRAARHDGSIGQCGYDGHTSRWPGGLFDVRRAGCDGRTGDKGRGCANSKQRRSVARSAKGRSLFVARLAELRTELSIRPPTALDRHADGQDYRPSLNSHSGCISSSDKLRFRLTNATADTRKFATNDLVGRCLIERKLHDNRQ